jgi:hypothetical protein
MFEQFEPMGVANRLRNFGKTGEDTLFRTWS